VETFVSDMDDCLRELGVGDLTVPKKVKRAAAGLYERIERYGEAVSKRNVAQLSSQLDYYVPGKGVRRETLALAQYTLDVAHLLAELAAVELNAGRAEFPPPAHHTYRA
jgi:cytochrome b pre-mRNA-processing protein 3